MRIERRSRCWRKFLLVQAVAACALALASQATTADETEGEGHVPRVVMGYAPEAETILITARGTGRTTGHIADLIVTNHGDEPLALPPDMFFIPSDGRFQSYVGRPATGHEIPPGETREVPVEGYCTTVRKPPVPAAEAMPPVENWVVSTGETGPASLPPVEDALVSGRALVPGTDTPLLRAVDVDAEPLTAAPFLFAALAEIERATSELQASGDLVTPFSANPEREREAVIQQTLWIFASELKNDPYIKEEFSERLEAQYEQNTGVPVAEAPEEDRDRLESGADDFWGAFDLVGTSAKVLSHDPDADAIQFAEAGETAVPNEAGEESEEEDEAAAEDEPACGSIEGTVSFDPARLAKAVKNIVVYVDGECSYCPPEPEREKVVLTEDLTGIHPSFVVVPAGTTIELVNGFEDEIDWAPEFMPSPVDDKHTHPLDLLRKGEKTEFTPTISASGSYTGHYLVESRWHKRSDATMFVTPNECYAVADENGHYFIGELPPATYTVKVYTRLKRTNFAEAEAVVEEGKVTTRDFLLDRKIRSKEAEN